MREAFDLDSEPQKVRDRYGYPAQYTPRLRAGGDNPGWNQRLLLARRLVEAGVRLVTVDLRWWDTHDDNFWALKNGFLPPFDQSYSALIEDLDQRGLLDTTMVVAWGEHGRTPRVNATAGRDHWMSAFSAAIAGGGIRGGRVVGSTDSQAGDREGQPEVPAGRAGDGVPAPRRRSDGAVPRPCRAAAPGAALRQADRGVVLNEQRHRCQCAASTSHLTPCSKKSTHHVAFCLGRAKNRGSPQYRKTPAIDEIAGPLIGL